MEAPDRRLIKLIIFTFRESYLPKLREAVDLLNDAELWSREADTTNSVGNLLMHLSGNLRQHIISGIGGAPDERNRPLEFAARGGISREVLWTELERTVEEACAVLEKIDPAVLSEERVIQDKPVAVMDDLFTTVTHYAYHAGQIIHLVKAVKHHSFAWYRYLDKA